MCIEGRALGRIKLYMIVFFCCSILFASVNLLFVLSDEDSEAYLADGYICYHT